MSSVRRRSARASAAVLTVTAAAVLAACGSDSGSSSVSVPSGSTTGGGASTAAATGDLDTVTWDLPSGEPVTLEPFQELSVTVTQNMCETLQYRDPDTGKLIPGLAESTEYPDAKTVVFNLRSDATFWDGNPVTADDVVFSLKRSAGLVKSYVPSPFAGYWQFLKSISATGPHQVTVTFSKPNVLFRQETSMLGVTAVHEKAYYQRVGQKYGSASGGLMCSGPFKLDKWEPGTELVLVPNEQYWNKALIPHVKRLVFKFITDNAAITAGLESGEIDGSMSLPPSAATTLQNSKTGSLLIGDGPETRVIIPFGGSLQSAEMRRALSLTIDRPGIAKAVYGGTAVPLAAYYPQWTFSFEKPTFEAGNKAIPGIAPDLEAAKAAFEQAGSPQTPVRLGVDGADQTAVRTASIIQSGAKQIGMNVQIVTLSTNRYQNVWVDPNARKGLDGGLLFSTYAVPDPGEEIGYFFLTASPFNYIHYANKQVNDLTIAQISETDPAKRAQMLVDAQAQAIGKDWVTINFVNLKPLAFLRNGIGGFTSSWYNRSYPWAARLGSTDTQ